MSNLGLLAPYSCAECHGPLWRIDGDGPIRFRCHGGHAYTAESLVSAQVDGTEALRWDVLRTLEERSALVREISERAKGMGHASEATSWARRARVLEEEAAELRNQLAQRKVARPQRAPLKRSRA